MTRRRRKKRMFFCCCCLLLLCAFMYTSCVCIFSMVAVICCKQLLQWSHRERRWIVPNIEQCLLEVESNSRSRFESGCCFWRRLACGCYSHRCCLRVTTRRSRKENLVYLILVMSACGGLPRHRCQHHGAAAAGAAAQQKKKRIHLHKIQFHFAEKMGFD